MHKAKQLPFPIRLVNALIFLNGLWYAFSAFVLVGGPAGLPRFVVGLLLVWVAMGLRRLELKGYRAFFAVVGANICLNVIFYLTTFKPASLLAVIFQGLILVYLRTYRGLFT